MHSSCESSTPLINRPLDVHPSLTFPLDQLESALLRLSRQILHPLSRSANRTANTTVPRDGATNNGTTEENSANAYGGASNGNLGSNGVAGDLGEMEIPDVQVTIRSGQNMLQFRELTVSEIGKTGSMTVDHELNNIRGRL